MYFTLEIHHTVKSGKEKDFLAKLKEFKGESRHFRNGLLDNMILSYILDPKTDDTVASAALPDSYAWHSYLEAPSRVKIRMSS